MSQFKIEGLVAETRHFRNCSEDEKLYEYYLN